MRPFCWLYIALLSGATACTGSHNASENNAPQTEQGTAAHPKQLDLPALVGKNIDQLRRLLGDPLESRDELMGPEPNAEQLKATKGAEWINTFEKSGSTIVVTFNAKSRKVLDMVLIGSDEDELMRRGNLSLTAPEYIVLPVPDPKHPQSISGVRMVSRR